MNEIKIFSFSGSGENGRNCYALQTEQGIILLDCGVKRETVGEQVGFYPPLTEEVASQVRMVFLSHCHEDHSAALPMLYHLGYNGEVYAAQETIDAAPGMIRKWMAYVEKQGGSLPFPQSAAEKIRFSPLSLGSNLVNGLPVEVGRSGHVLGGVWFQFPVQGKKVLYTGDMTLQPSSLAVDLPEPCDAAIMNCAYAGQCISQEKQYQKLLELIETTACAGGKVLLPLPPKGRGSDVLKLVSAHGFGVPVFVEEQIVTCYQELQKKSLWLSQADEQGTCAANLTIVKNENERQQALNTAGGAVYLASDGMLTAPDGLVYFNALKADGNSLVIITGHAAAGTVGAGLFDEEYRRKNDVSVRAEKIICKVHLDEQDALSLQERLGFKKVILFHAIKEKNKSLLESFKERNIEALASSLPQTITL